MHKSDPDIARINGKIVTWSKSENISPAQLSRHLKCDYSTAWRLLNGKKKTKCGSVQKLCKYALLDSDKSGASEKKDKIPKRLEESIKRLLALGSKKPEKLLEVIEALEQYFKR